MRVRNQRLPIGYRELEYIEGTGTQYIATTFKPKETSGMYFKASTDSTADTVFVGLRENNIRWWVGNSGWKVYGGWNLNDSGDSRPIISSNVPFTYKLNYLNDRKRIFNDTEITPIGSSTIGTITIAAYIMAGNGDGTASGFIKTGRIYFVKFSDEGNIVCNFIPAERVSDGKPGMYDTVNNTFYVNSGSGEFIKGPYNDSYQVSLGPRLPLEYQEVEYIESTGTQYIDSGFIPNQNSRVVLVATSTITGITGLNIFGARKGTGQGYFGLAFITDHYGSDAGYRVLYGTTYQKYSYGSESQFETKRVLDLNKNKFYIDGDLKITMPVSTFNSEYSAAIFGTNVSGNISIIDNEKLYYCQIYDNGTLVRNFIPCYRKSDNVIGLYDVVNNVFYTNQGTGTFLKGNNVNNYISCKVAGGSSDIYYGYNQKISNGQFENGTSEWAGIESSISIINGKLRCTPNTKTLCGFKQDNFKGIVGHKYYIDVQGIDLSNIVNDNTTQILFSMNSANAYFIYRTNDMSITSWNTIYTCPDTASSYLTLFRIYLTFNNGTHSGYFDIGSVSIIDLTDWYGAGKEPSTVDEFKTKFPNDYYGCCITPIKLTQYQIEALPSYGYNQLSNISTYSQYDCTQTKNIDGTYTLTGTQSRFCDWKLRDDSIIAGHKYLAFIIYLDGSFTGSGEDIRFLVNTPSQVTKITSSSQIKLGVFFSHSSSQRVVVVYYSGYGSTGTYNNYHLAYQVIDLTNWYGEGNEPTTIEEFKATFPNKYYPYSKKRLLNKYMINKLIN